MKLVADVWWGHTCIWLVGMEVAVSVCILCTTSCRWIVLLGLTPISASIRPHDDKQLYHVS